MLVLGISQRVIFLCIAHEWFPRAERALHIGGEIICMTTGWMLVFVSQWVFWNHEIWPIHVGAYDVSEANEMTAAMINTLVFSLIAYFLIAMSGIFSDKLQAAGKTGDGFRESMKALKNALVL